MAYRIIPDKCVNCGACEGECPTGAIEEKDGKRWIDPDKCANCGSCVAACPSEAIVDD